MATSRYSSDPRIDRAMTWGLTAFAGISLAVGAWFFRDLSAQVSGLSEAVGGLRTEVAVLRVEREKGEQARSKELADMKEFVVRILNDHESRIRALEAPK